MSGASADEPTDRSKQPITGIGVQLVEVPTSALDDPRARLYIIDRLAPGRTIDRRIQVTNGTPRPARVTLYAAAADIDKGQFQTAAGHTQNEVSTWTSVSPRSLDLAPREQALTKVRVYVPADAAPGERYGVVWAQVTTAPSSPGGIRQVSRAGIRLYLSIGPGNAPPSDFRIESLTAGRETNGKPTVTAEIRNTGGRALDLTGQLRLTRGPGGLAAGPFPAPSGNTVGIKQTHQLTVPLNAQIPNGPWRATLTLTSGLLKRSAHATITFPAGAGLATPQDTSTSAVTWWLITAGAALLLLLLALAWILLIMKRRRRSRRNDYSPIPSATPDRLGEDSERQSQRWCAVQTTVGD